MITIETWDDTHQFTRVNGKRPDAWFMRYTSGLEPPRYPVPSTLGPITQGLTTNTLVLWPADELGPALEIWGNGSLTIGEILGLHPKVN